MKFEVACATYLVGENLDEIRTNILKKSIHKAIIFNDEFTINVAPISDKVFDNLNLIFFMATNKVDDQIVEREMIIGTSKEIIEEEKHIFHYKKHENNGEILTVKDNLFLFNVIPHIDLFNDNGYSKEELKVILESKNTCQFSISCTAGCNSLVKGYSKDVTINNKQINSLKQKPNVYDQCLHFWNIEDISATDVLQIEEKCINKKILVIR